jgi:hypothetical protein
LGASMVVTAAHKPEERKKERKKGRKEGRKVQ